MRQIERRFYPRYPASFPVQMRLKLDGDESMELAGFAVNISLAGLQLTCTKGVVDTLLSQSHRPVVCQLMMFFANMPALEICDSKLVVHRRIKQDKYHLGFEFISLKDETKNAIQSFIELIKSNSEPEQQVNTKANT